MGASMRVVLTTVIVITTAVFVDTMWFDGAYRADVAGQISYESQIFARQVNYLIRKVISP
jgi:hypothetical protein